VPKLAGLPNVGSQSRQRSGTVHRWATHLLWIVPVDGKAIALSKYPGWLSATFSYQLSAISYQHTP